jgi:hypothetical protein
MEKMTGPRWNSVLKEESQRVKSFLKKHPVQDRLNSFYHSYEKTQRKIDPIKFDCGSAVVEWESAFFKNWRFKGTSRQREARDIICKNEIIWTTTDIRNGAEYFELQCWTNACKLKPSWKMSPVGPDLGILGNTLYYLNVKNKLIYHELWCCDANTGANKRLLYKEKNPEVIFISSEEKNITTMWESFPKMTAVANNNIFTFNGSVMNRAGPRIAEATEQLCEKLELARQRRSH